MALALTGSCRDKLGGAVSISLKSTKFTTFVAAPIVRSFVSICDCVASSVNDGFAGASPLDPTAACLVSSQSSKSIQFTTEPFIVIYFYSENGAFICSSMFYHLYVCCVFGTRSCTTIPAKVGFILCHYQLLIKKSCINNAY